MPGPVPDWETWTHDPYLCVSCRGAGVKIPIKAYVMDHSLRTWEERYKKLEAHHNEEATWLINEVLRLEKLVKELEAKVPPGSADMRSWCDGEPDVPEPENPTK